MNGQRCRYSFCLINLNENWEKNLNIYRYKVDDKVKLRSSKNKDVDLILYIVNIGCGIFKNG